MVFVEDLTNNPNKGKIMESKWFKKLDEDEYGDNFNSVVLVKMDDYDENPHEVIKDTYAYRCDHDWDCCGCLMTRVRRILSCGGIYYLVFLGNYRNV